MFFTQHRIIVLVSGDVSRFYHDAFTHLGATVITRTPPPLYDDSIEYYRGCLLKLAAFELFNLQPPLERMVVMDSDQLVLKDLDPVFGLAPAEVSAPKAYWIDDHTYSSTIISFRPSRRLWVKVSEAMQDVPPGTYDMDILNGIFGDTLEELPPTYGTLNSHWEDKNTPPWFLSEVKQASQSSLDQDLRELFARVDVLRFTAVGKPWMHDIAKLIAMRPDAHPTLVEQWASWRTSALQLCSSGLIDHV